MDKSSTRNSFIKNLSSVMALWAIVGIFGNEVYAESFTFPIDKDGTFPIRFEQDEVVGIKMDIGFLFDNIESVCIKGSIKEGNASSVIYSAISEPNPPFFPIVISEAVSFSYSTGSPNVPSPQEIELCDTFVMPTNFLDSDGIFDMEATGGYLEFWNLSLEVNGTLGKTQISVSLNEDDEFTVPFYGGKVKYRAKIQNLDSSSTAKVFKQWSAITFPNGDTYPVRKLRDVELNYAESKEFKRARLDIPAWFEAGDYTLVWYLADPETGARVKDTMQFTKE